MCMKKVNLIWCQSETITIRIGLQCLDRLMQKQWKTIGNSQVGILSPVSHPFLCYMHPQIFNFFFFLHQFFSFFSFLLHLSPFPHPFMHVSISFTTPFVYLICYIWNVISFMFSSISLYLYTILVNAALVFIYHLCCVVCIVFCVGCSFVLPVNCTRWSHR